MEDVPNAKPRMHIFICTNDRTSIPDNTTPSCGPTIKDEDIKTVKMWLRANEHGDVQCTKTKCLGWCNEDGGVMCVYPSGRFVKGLRSVDDIKRVVIEEINRASSE